MTLLLVLGATAGWAEFLFKPLSATRLVDHGGVAGVIGDLLRPVPAIYGWPLAGYVFLLSTVAIAFLAVILLMRPVRWTLNYLDTSEAPVSVLESRINLYMNNAELSSCRTTRTQRLHANRRNVEAYHYAFSAIAGEVAEDSVTISSRIGDEEITARPLISRSEGKTIEIIEQFTRPLPTSLFVTYLPDAWVRALNNLHYFGNVIITRSVETDDSDEYSSDDPMFEITAVRYPASALTISLDFPLVTAPRPEDVRSYLISTSAVQKIFVDKRDQGGRRIFTAYLKYLKTQQSFRIQWRNTKLRAWQAKPAASD